MFEIEKNFILTKDQEEKITGEAKFLGEKVFTDVYYDNDNYILTKKDIWLRSRDGKFELKYPLLGNEKGDRYEEIENEGLIKDIIGVKANKTMKEDLEENGYYPFCICKTTRRKYKNGEFNIDIDFAEFDSSFSYNISEIELMVDDESKAKEASDKIINFAKNYNLKMVYTGKIIEYLKKIKPDHYQALVDVGMFKNY